MDWNLFWSAFGAIGGTLGAVATTAAVVVALWQTKYSQKKIIKLTFSDNFQLYNPNTGESVKFIGLSVTNIGNRKVIIRTWGVHLKEGECHCNATYGCEWNRKNGIYKAATNTGFGRIHRSAVAER